MHENKFEKQVQKKMEELQFVPSDAVWENVDKEINKDKKRRRPVFWLFFFFGLMLLGGGYFFSVNNKSKVQESKVVEDEAQWKKDQENKKQEIKGGGDKAKENNEENKEQEKNQETYSNPNSQNTKSVLNERRMKPLSGTKHDKVKSSPEGTLSTEKEESKSQEKNLSPKEITNEIADNKTESINKIEQPTDKKNVTDSSAIKKANIVASNKSVIKDSAIDKKVAANKKQQKKSAAWEIGVTVDAGISNVNESLFKSTYVTNPVAYSNAITGTNGYNVYTSSQINPDFSFGAGVFARKHLSKRVSFSAGINYHYYSTKIHTGNSVDSSIYVYLPGTAASATNGYYHNGSSNVYIDHYHFIELPVSINFQLNKSQKLPLIWEAGLSLSYLAGNNALLFDPITDVYYKNNKLFNKIQLNAATGIMLGFHIRKNELQLGPQFQYGLTGLLDKSTRNPEHLFYGGLKISFIPRKK